MAIPFDTLKFVERLEKAHMTREQASAIAAAVRDAHDAADFVTKKDLVIALAPILGRLNLLQWMMGVTLAGVGAIFAKLFL